MEQDREVVRCYYEFKTRKNIGPMGDFVTPGIYFTLKPFEAMEVQSNRAWYKLADGTMEMGRPQWEKLTTKEQLWVELKANRLTLF